MKTNIFDWKIRLVVLFVFALSTTCEEVWQASTDDDCDGYDYSDCETVEPKFGDLSIKVTINSANRRVPITVYRDDFEDDRLVLRDTATSDHIYIRVPVNRKYSVVAKYNWGDKTLLSIDGTEIEANSTEECDSTCWTVTGGKIDVRLKY